MEEVGPRAAAVVVIGVGARAAAGLTALQVTLCARALKMAISESHMIDGNGDPMGVVRFRALGDDVSGHPRLVALGGPALTEAALPWVLAQRKRGRVDVQLPLYLALPPQDRCTPDVEDERVLHDLAARSSVPIDRERTQVLHQCRGGGIAAFERAVRDIRSGKIEVAVVGGVDSYFDPDVLEHLDREMRLHGPKTENGFIPGEGAAFVLLADRQKVQGFAPQASVLSAATASEPHPYGSEEPNIGQGLTRAVLRAVEVLAPFERRIPWMLTDVANERHRVDEWAYTTARAHRAIAPDAVHEQPLLKTGDVGAASAAMLVAMAAVRWRTRCAAGDLALIAASSDGPERGAMLVQSEVTA